MYLAHHKHSHTLTQRNDYASSEWIYTCWLIYSCLLDFFLGDPLFKKTTSHSLITVSCYFLLTNQRETKTPLRSEQAPSKSSPVKSVASYFTLKLPQLCVFASCQLASWHPGCFGFFLRAPCQPAVLFREIK